MPNEPAAGAQPTGDSATPQPPAAGGTPPAQPADATKVEPQPKADGTQPKPGDKAGDAPKVPDKYALRVPEAAQVYVDDADLQHIETVARQAGWSNDDAQAALDEFAATLKAQSDRWQAETAADTEYGGAKLSETQRLARALVDRIRPVGHPRREAFMRLLNRGAGNHPQVVSFLADLGRLMAEDQPASGGGSGPPASDAASKLYDHTPAS